MKLSQVKGNTWVAEGVELIPFYRLEGGRCVLLDTGLLQEREELEAALLEAGLTPAGVLCSHAHVDHCANSRYFQEKYRIPAALTAPEAGMCATVLNLKCYFLTLSLGMVEREAACMVHRPDVILPGEDGALSFAGAEFQIIQTPGHSAGHISTVTPDNVCYAADALLSAELMEAKLPYNLNYQMAMASREKLRTLGCDAYIMAHRGVCGPHEIGPLIDANQAHLRHRTEELLSLIDRPMTAGEITQAACRHYRLFTSRLRRSLRYQRNVSFLIEYLVDEGELTPVLREGVAFYERSRPRADA